MFSFWRARALLRVSVVVCFVLVVCCDVCAGWARAWKAVAPLNYARSYAMVSALADSKGDTYILAAGGMSLMPFFAPMGSVEVLTSWGAKGPEP